MPGENNWKKEREDYFVQQRPTVEDWTQLQKHRLSILKLIQTGIDPLTEKAISINEIIATMQTELSSGNLSREIHEMQWVIIEKLRRIIENADSRLNQYLTKNNGKVEKKPDLTDEELLRFEANHDLRSLAKANMLKMFAAFFNEGYLSSMDLIQVLGHPRKEEGSKGKNYAKEFFEDLKREATAQSQQGTLEEKDDSDDDDDQRYE